MKRLLFVILAWFAFAAGAFAAVNVNTATKEELMTLKGIGDAKAQAIIDYRTKKGPFKSVEDVDKVPGIGQGILGKIKNDIAFSGATTVSPAAAKKADGKKVDDKKVQKNDKAAAPAPATPKDLKTAPAAPAAKEKQK